MDIARGFAARRGNFRMEFENGYTVSVVFGNLKHVDPERVFEGETVVASATAEVAVLRDDKLLYYWGEDADQVKGWQSPADVLALMVEVAAL